MRFKVDFKDKTSRAIFFLFLSVLFLLTAFYIPKNYLTGSNIDKGYFEIFIYYDFTFAFSFFCIFIGIKLLKIQYRNILLEIVIHDEKIEFPKILIETFSLSETEKTYVRFDEIKNIKLMGRPDSSFCYLKIEYRKAGKRKRINNITNQLFENRDQFREFLSKLSEKHKIL